MTNQHSWALTSIFMSVISDIRRRRLLFRYRKKICLTENSHSGIGRVSIENQTENQVEEPDRKQDKAQGLEPGRAQGTEPGGAQDIEPGGELGRK